MIEFLIDFMTRTFFTLLLSVICTKVPTIIIHVHLVIIDVSKAVLRRQTVFHGVACVICRSNTENKCYFTTCVKSLHASSHGLNC